MTKMYSHDVRRLAVRAYTSFDMTCRAVARLLDVSKTSVMRWVAMRHIIKLKRPVRCKVTSGVLATIKAELDSDPFLTAADLSVLVHAKCGVSLSRHTIPSCLKKIQYTRKRTYARSPDTVAMQTRRDEYQDLVRTIDMHDAVSIDETAFYLDAKPSHGYCKKGVRIGVPLTRYRCTKVTLILAVGTEGIQHWGLYH